MKIVDKVHINFVIEEEIFLPIAMDFPVIILQQFFKEAAILVEDVVTHVGNVMEDCLIFNLKKKCRILITQKRTFPVQ